MHPAPSFFEPVTQVGKRHAYLLWLLAGLACALFVWVFGNPLLNDRSLPAAIVLAALFAFAAPVYMIYLQRAYHSLVHDIETARSNPEFADWLARQSRFLRFSHPTNVLMSLGVAFGATVVAFVIAPSLGYDPLDRRYLAFWCGGLLGFFLGGVAATACLRLSQAVLALPNDAFHLGFQKKANRLLGRLQGWLVQAAFGISVLWLIQFAAFALLDVLDNPAAVAWMLISSTAPLGPTILMLLRAHAILVQLKERDLAVVDEAIEASLSSMRAGTAGDVERLNRLLELQDRVSRSKEWPGFGISFGAVGVSSIAPLVSVLADLWPRLAS